MVISKQLARKFTNLRKHGRHIIIIRKEKRFSAFNHISFKLVIVFDMKDSSQHGCTFVKALNASLDLNGLK